LQDLRATGIVREHKVGVFGQGRKVRPDFGLRIERRQGKHDGPLMIDAISLRVSGM
jgi:hypothetical protein